MNKLLLLFTQDGLQFQLNKGRSTVEEGAFFVTEETPAQYIEQKLAELLSEKSYGEIITLSALNHFTMMPAGFSVHDMGYQLIGYNAAVDRTKEELMLSVNKKYELQFYYAFPKVYYSQIKGQNKPTFFNFSGEKFLSSLHPKNGKEIHINLYHNQCEFFAIDRKKVILYNNLDVNSEVDFLYFVMFTLSKIGFQIKETNFYVYGETTENETFISELRKFVKNLKISFDNIPNKNFILS